MRTSLLIRTALRSLAHHPGRSCLTILGIVIGISAIVSTFAIGRGSEKKLAEQIEAMGDNFLVINPSNWAEQGKTTKRQLNLARHATTTEARVIKEQCPQVANISGMTTTKRVLNHGHNYVYGIVKGGNASVIRVINRKMQAGSFYTDYHVQRAAKVMVLGSKCAKDLFGLENPLGNTVYLKNLPFTVIGIIDEMENFFSTQDPNYDVFIPLTVAKTLLHPYLASDRVHYLAMNTYSKEGIPITKRKITRILRARHGLEEGEPNDFMIWDQAGIAKAAEAGKKVMSLFVLIAASISLLVGGIGVMNIMLVSVTERTKEIGIKMALGATTNMIRRQFLLESITLCSLGGMVGVVLGIIAPVLLKMFTKLPAIIEVTPIAISFGVTCLIGVFFGYYPARKASLLNPVEALLDR